MAAVTGRFSEKSFMAYILLPYWLNLGIACLVEIDYHIIKRLSQAHWDIQLVYWALVGVGGRLFSSQSSQSGLSFKDMKGREAFNYYCDIILTI